MLEELVQIRRYIDEVIETYKDLHPDEKLPEIGITIGQGSMTIEEYERANALRKIREREYENEFRKSQGKKTTGSSQGQPALCVYGDS